MKLLKYQGRWEENPWKYPFNIFFHDITIDNGQSSWRSTNLDYITTYERYYNQRKVRRDKRQSVRCKICIFNTQNEETTFIKFDLVISQQNNVIITKDMLSRTRRPSSNSSFCYASSNAGIIFIRALDSNPTKSWSWLHVSIQNHSPNGFDTEPQPTVTKAERTFPLLLHGTACRYLTRRP